VIDDYTVRFNLTVFENTFLPILWFMPSYVSSPTNWDKLGKTKAELSAVGTGPFILTDLVTDDHATYVRNPNYWQPGKPYLDGFNYRVIADPTTQELLFRNGQVDIPPIDADIQQRMKDLGIFQFFPSDLPPPTFWALTPDAGNPSSPWANLKVRLAADYAINKEAISMKLGGPTASPQYQWAPPGTYGYIPDYPSRKYDPAKAKQLLAEAGYPNGFKTTAFVGSTISYVRDMELAVHEYWRQIGIDVAYNQMTLPTFLDKSKNGWTNGIMDGAPRIVPDWLIGTYGTFSPTATTSMVSMLRPPELEQMMLQAKRTPDMAVRDKLAKDINRYVTDNCLTIQVYSGGGIGGTLYQKNVHGVGPDNYWGPSKLWGPADYWKSK
jgi:peptide/nickel transport system substrate-binding protein